MQKKSISTWVFAGALAVLLFLCLGMVFDWWDSRGSLQQMKWGGRPMNAMDKARNADTSNLDNVLKF